MAGAPNQNDNDQRAIHISDSMNLRNQLRAGLLEAPMDAMSKEPSEPSEKDPGKGPSKRGFSSQSLADDIFATLKNKQK